MSTSDTQEVTDLRTEGMTSRTSRRLQLEPGFSAIDGCRFFECLDSRAKSKNVSSLAVAMTIDQSDIEHFERIQHLRNALPLLVVTIGYYTDC